MQNGLKELYLKTLRDCLTGKAYGDGQVPNAAWRWLARMLGFNLSRKLTEHDRDNGEYWPATALTMSGTKRLDNLRHCLERVVYFGIPGDIVECGVWRGGAAIYAAGVLAVNESNRQLYLCDSFQGLPRASLPPDASDPRWPLGDLLAVSKEQVWRNFCRFHLGNGNVHLVDGWFKNTLPTLPCHQIAVLRADGDMYESTWDILENLYPRVSLGGYVIIDDYNSVPACQQAVEDYLRKHELNPILMPIDRMAVYWKVA